jgi:hypothetical protein
MRAKIITTSEYWLTQSNIIFSGIIPFALLVIVTFTSSIKAQQNLTSEVYKSKIEYQQAARYTALDWHNSLQSPIKASFSPLINFSGIATDAEQHNPEYYDHGKLPNGINSLTKDLIISTRQFNLNDHSADVELTLTLNRYSHPFIYAPDDHWYKKLEAQVDRWAVTKKNASVSLSLKLSSKSNRFKPWLTSVDATLSHCDLNSISHPLLPINQKDPALNAYVKSAMGQTFIAASNYLLLQAIEHMNSQQQRAQIIESAHNELLLSSAQVSFITGKKYQLIFNNHYGSKRQQPAGQIQVIKSMGGQAIAYPLNLRPDHIKAGDWVEIGPTATIKPTSRFIPQNQCASVSTAKVVSASSEEPTIL